jgi:uncharacterized protein HemX
VSAAAAGTFGAGAAGVAAGGGVMFFKAAAAAGALKATGGAIAIFGGPVGWAIAGGLALGGFIAGKAIEKRKKKKFDSQKEALKQEAIAKQNRIIKEQERVIETLIKKQQEAERRNAQNEKIIKDLAKRIDYLNGIIVATQAIVEACA